MATVSDLVALLEQWFDPSWAEHWDTVGLALGRAGATVDRVHIAVDPTAAVASEAAAAGAQLLITHHPLWLGGTDSIADTHPTGKVAGILADAGCALYVAHTNADVALPGVSDALAAALSVRETVALAPQEEQLDRWVVHCPVGSTPTVIDAMAAAGAGAVGDYERCAFVTDGEGTFLPGVGAHPHSGEIGRRAQVAEQRLEMVAPRATRNAVAAAIRTVHPYEEPSVTVVEAATPSRRGLGRVGHLAAPTTLADFLVRVAAALPATPAGIRATGDPDQVVSRVAVAGGSCLDLVGLAARSGAQVFLTSDAKHHRALEAPIPVIDVPHWAGEWPWAAELAARLATETQLPTTASTLVTDPWTQHRCSSGAGGSVGTAV